MADLDSALATVRYYARERYYHHMTVVLADQLHRFGSDPLLLFWRAFGLIMEERLSDGMAELTQLQDTPDLQLATSILLMYAHKQCQIIDKEAIQKLETTVRGYRSTAGEKALYYGAMVLWLLDKHDKAREYTEKLLQRVAPKSREGKVVRGWIDLTSGREVPVKKCIKYFDDVIQSGDVGTSFDAILGKARYYMTRYNFKAALDVLNRMVSSSPSFLPALVEKMRVELASQLWDSAIETAHRCLSIDSQCIEAIKVLALELCVRKGDMDETADVLEQLIQQLDQSEPRTHRLYYDISAGFARMADGHSGILQHTKTLLERAISMSPSCPDYAIEQAHQSLLEGRVQDALVTFRRAFSLDEMSIPAMMGLLHCQLLTGKRSEAQQQLEFLNELQPAADKLSYLEYLNALLCASKGGANDEVVTLLTSSANTHFNHLKGMYLSFDYYKMANPDFIHRLADSMMQYSGSEPSSVSTSVLQTVATVLDPLAHTAPGLTRVQLVLARVKFLLGESDAALLIAQQCAKHNHCSVEALLLQSMIHLHNEHTRKSEQALETALSNNFEVQQYPLYHLLKGRINRSNGKYSAALTSLNTAVSLLRTPPTKSKVTTTPLLPPLPLGQQVTTYIELVHTLSALGDQDEAGKIMQEAIDKFSGSSEEARVTISNADLALSTNNTNKALQLLQQIGEDKVYYIQAREKMAEVYLVHFGDKQKYIQCYQELSSKLTGPPTATLLGDAYLNVHEFDQALTVFEQALKKNPRDAVLASRVGKVLVRTHQYGKAINYYETSLKSINLPELRIDLADLYLRLSQHDKAVRTLQTGLDRAKGEGDNELDIMMEDVQYSLLLARAHKMNEDTAAAASVLQNTISLQSRVLHLVSVEQPELLSAQKRLGASISCQLAELAMTERENLEEAVQWYHNALEQDPNNITTQVAVAGLELRCGHVDECEQQCHMILQADPSNEEAAVMMADVLYQKGEVEMATRQLEDIVERRPDNFEALVRLIEVGRRRGVVSETSKTMTMVEHHCTQVVHQPGLMYCKGLYYWYTGDTELALKSFNNARKDSEWGERAVVNMILLCLNPDNDILGAETLKASESDSGGSVERLDAELMAVRTAEKLLKEVHPQSAASRLKLQLLENSVLLASRTKQNVEKALANYTKMMSTERESVAILAGMATANLLLKQVPRARNHLKRVSKLMWNMEEANDFEKSWLLLADVYIQSGKYDMAIERLKKCILHNKSCSKAWEYLGFISEKEQACKDAAEYYEKAWKYSHCRNPAVGYRLAFNYLKSRKYVEAVDVCHKVLQHNPSYPRIRKEVMEKARHNIRL